jgi:membrane-associated protease RseP (regulator of RpoE activity)
LPIPALDGGHVFFTLLEMVMRKRLHTQLYNYLTLGGFVLLMSFMLFVTGLDLVKYTPLRSAFCDNGRHVAFVCDLSDLRN